MDTDYKRIQRVVFIGAECTGKSTLAKAISQFYEEPYSMEYVRLHVDGLDRELNETDLEPIARGQIAIEDEAAVQANKYVFHDTNLLSSILYADHYFNTRIPWVDEIFAKRDYAYYFFCQPDIPWEADVGQRESPEERRLLHGRFEEKLKEYKIPFTPVSGALDERIKTVTEVLSKGRVAVH